MRTLAARTFASRQFAPRTLGGIFGRVVSVFISGAGNATTRIPFRATSKVDDTFVGPTKINFTSPTKINPQSTDINL